MNKDGVEQLFEPLIGQKIHAFGLDSKGLWGQSDKVREFTIEKVKCDYVDEPEQIHGKYKQFATVNIYLTEYYYGADGLIYTCRLFEKELRALIKKFKINVSADYSEMGMQGPDFVNLDVSVKL